MSPFDAVVERAWARVQSGEFEHEARSLVEATAGAAVSVEAQLAATVDAQGKTEAELFAELEHRGECATTPPLHHDSSVPSVHNFTLIALSRRVQDRASGRSSRRR